MAIADWRKREVIIMRDRTGIKPGVLGWKDGKYGVASEDIAFRKNGVAVGSPQPIPHDEYHFSVDTYFLDTVVTIIEMY